MGDESTCAVVMEGNVQVHGHAQVNPQTKTAFALAKDLVVVCVIIGLFKGHNRKNIVLQDLELAILPF